MPGATTAYQLHGLTIAIPHSQALSEALHARLRQLPKARLRQMPQDRYHAVDFAFEHVYAPDGNSHEVERPRGRARPVYEATNAEITYFNDQQQVYIRYRDQGRALCDIGAGRVRVSVLESAVDGPWMVSHPLFTIPLVELLKDRGLYSVHAAGLCLDRRGLLLAGESGAGKSTLTVALLRAGFGFLGDDMVFLTPRQEGLRALAFPDEIDVTGETFAWFPELHARWHMPAAPSWPKRRVWAEEVYGVEPSWECTPAAVVFPRVACAAKSVLQPISKDDALLELVPNILLTEARSSQAHLDVLGELVRSTACYRLHTGRDFDALPRLLGELLH